MSPEATTPAHIGERLAASIRTRRMVPYDDGKGGTLYREAKPTELAEHLARDVVQPLIDAAERRGEVAGSAPLYRRLDAVLTPILGSEAEDGAGLGLVEDVQLALEVVKRQSLASLLADLNVLAGGDDPDAHWRRSGTVGMIRLDDLNRIRAKHTPDTTTEEKP